MLQVFTRSALAQPAGRTIEVNDAVRVLVVDQPDESKTYIVGADGTVTMPLVGRVAAAGRTASQIASELQRRLATYFVRPDVHVEIVHLNRVFLFGDVKTPGEFSLPDDTTLLELLARSGYVGTPDILVLRSRNARGPIAIGDRNAEVIRVSLAQLEKETSKGRLSRNVILSEGDTVYVTKGTADVVHVSGEVDRPGAYSILEGTTVLQALTLAGGATRRASLRGMQILRVQGEEQRSLGAGLEDVLQPGDTLYVPRGYSMPWPTFGRPDISDREVHAIRFGPVSFVPSAALTEVGVDSNVFNSAGQPVSDFVTSGGPAADLIFDVKPVRATVTGALEFVYFKDYASQRAVNRTGSATLDIDPSRRIRFHLAGNTNITNDRPDSEIDARVPRIYQSVEASVLVRPWQRMSFEVGFSNFDQWFTAPFVYLGVDLADTLTERVQAATLTTNWILTPFTTITGSAAVSTHRFDINPRRDADANEFTGGALWHAGGLLSGEARVGYMQYLSRDPGNPDLRGLIGDVDVFYTPAERTRIGATVSRSTSDTYHEQFAFALVDRLGASVQQGFLRRYDVLAESYLERWDYKSPNFVTGHPTDGYETSFRHVLDIGVRTGPVRTGIDVTYLQRFADFLQGRNYNTLMLTANVTYGVARLNATQ
ncbi:MAG TPA: SLBB domain-containing protein [Vicinamibacterales bacterium]|nr:SLBB domain-containing protein [Vicinamibacterales bacterium]